MKQFFSPWVLVLTGIVFNIFSAIITSHFIGVNNNKIHGIEDKISSVKVRIDSLWQNRQDIERKKEFFLLLIQMREGSQAGQSEKRAEVTDSYLENYLEGLVGDYGLSGEILQSIGSLSPQGVIEITELAKQRIVSDIDDIYLEKILLEKEKQPIVNRNSTLMGMALFLQLVGLILVLARDLSRV